MKINATPVVSSVLIANLGDFAMERGLRAEPMLAQQLRQHRAATTPSRGWRPAMHNTLRSMRAIRREISLSWTCP